MDSEDAGAASRCSSCHSISRQRPRGLIRSPRALNRSFDQTFAVVVGDFNLLSSHSRDDQPSSPVGISRFSEHNYMHSCARGEVVSLPSDLLCRAAPRLRNLQLWNYDLP